MIVEKRVDVSRKANVGYDVKGSFCTAWRGCCLVVTVSLSLSVTNVTEVLSALVSVRKEFTHIEVAL